VRFVNNVTRDSAEGSRRTRLFHPAARADREGQLGKTKKQKSFVLPKVRAD
jgi:hypothetical protein